MADVDYTQVFMNCARKLDGSTIGLNIQEDTLKGGLNINRDFLKDKKILNSCLAVASTYLDESIIKGVNNDRYMRSLLLDNFPQDKELFIGSDGEFHLGLENINLLYYKYKNKAWEHTNDITALRFLYAYRVLKQEFESLYKASSRGIIAPIFKLNPQFFGWTRAQEITRKYSLYATIPEGYNCYYFERPNLAQIVFLYICGRDLKDAIKYMNSVDRGIFYNFLPKDVEECMMPAILSGKTGGINTVWKDKLVKFEDNLLDKYDSEMYTVYNVLVKPHMIEIIGGCIDAVLKEIAVSKPELNTMDAFVYHVAPQRFGLAIKDGIHIEDILPHSYKLFKRVYKPIYTDMSLCKYM